MASALKQWEEGCSYWRWAGLRAAFFAGSFVRSFVSGAVINFVFFLFFPSDWEIFRQEQKKSGKKISKTLRKCCYSLMRKREEGGGGNVKRRRRRVGGGTGPSSTAARRLLQVKLFIMIRCVQEHWRRRRRRLEIFIKMGRSSGLARGD